jgi:hypothetical protein
MKMKNWKLKTVVCRAKAGRVEFSSGFKGNGNRGTTIDSPSLPASRFSLHPTEPRPGRFEGSGGVPKLRANANERQSRRGKRAKRGRAKRGTGRAGQLVRKTEDWDGDRCSGRPHYAFSVMIQGCSPWQLLSTSHGLGLGACKQGALTRRRAASVPRHWMKLVRFENPLPSIAQYNTQSLRDAVGCVSNRLSR